MNKKEKKLPDEGGAEAYPVKRHHSFTAKIVCVLLALILWLYVMETENPDWEQTVSDVPVTLINTAEIEENNLTIYNGYGATVDVTLRGRKNQVTKITADDLSVTADVSDIKEAGEHTLPLSVAVSDEYKSETQLISSTMDSVTVFVDKKDKITVDLRTRFTGLVIAPEYLLGEAVTSVSSVTVTGPSRYLKNIAYAEVPIPDLGRVTSSLTVYGNIVLIDTDGDVVSNPYVSMAQSEVSVSIPVYAYKNVPLTVNYKYGYFNDENSNVTFSPPTVYVKGDAAKIEALQSIPVTTIDEKTVSDDDVIRVALSMPDGIENIDGVSFVEVTVTNIGTTTRKMIVALTDDNIINPNHVGFSLDNRYVSVTLRGTAEDLNRLTMADVAAKIDLSAYTAGQSGTFTLPVTIEVASAGLVYELGDYSAEIRIN